MDAHWQAVTQLFDQLVQSTSERKKRLLEKAKDLQPEVYQEVLSLLEEEEQLHPLLEQDASGLFQTFQDEQLIGQQIGSFNLTALIGEGGMGSVFLGERADGEFDQKVAIKLIRPHWMNEEALQGFRKERQILAQLQHPNIARLYDGGLSPDGRPYFTMEWVSGIPINEFVKEQAFSLKQILELFQQVCYAIQYAHQNLVIHLDLKPGNILVDQTGQVKLLDFGIAGIMGPGQASIEEKAFTLAYCAPEQYQRKAVSTRTDVYALGLILYELLAGVHPFMSDLRAATDKKSFRDRLVLSPPSQFVSKSKGSENMQAYPIDRDLDTICMKALEPLPADRYISIEALTKDLAAYFQNRPISLREKDQPYRLKKFFQRYRTATLLTLTFVIALVGTITYFLVQLAGERNTALQEAEKANRIKELTLDIFRQANPNEVQRSDVTGLEILQNGLGAVKENLRNQPELMPDMYAVISDAFKNLGYFQEARQSSVLGFQAVQNLHQGPHPDIAEQLLNLASVYRAEYVDLEKADSLTELAFQILQKAPVRNPELEARVYNDLAAGAYDRSDYPLCDSLYSLALEKYEALPNRKIKDEAFCLQMLGTTYRKMELWEEAEKFMLRAKQAFKSLYDPPHVDLAWNQNHLASLYLNMGMPEKAEPFAKEAWQQRDAIFGANHFETIASQSNLGRIYMRLGKYSEALAQFSGAYQALASMFPQGHTFSASMMSNMANAEIALGNRPEGESWLRQSIAMQEKLLAPNDIRHSLGLQSLGVFLIDENKASEALPILQKSLKLREESLPEGHTSIAVVQVQIGRGLIQMNQADASMEYLNKALSAFSTDTVIHRKNWIQTKHLIEEAIALGKN